VRLRGITVFVACCLVAAVAAACGGGSSENKAPDSSKVPTATLPATLPVPRIISGAVQTGGATSYTVKDGDTLAGIAAKFGVSLDDLRAANPNVDPSRLSVGTSLKLPAPPADAQTPAPTKPAATATSAAQATEPPATGPPAATETAAPITPTSLGQTYTVQAGDIPATIAQKFGITVEELMAANPGLDPTNLQIGQVLIIPPKRQG